jgi:hypothetical protein
MLGTGFVFDELALVAQPRSAASVSRLSSSVRHWRGAATRGVRLRSWRDGAQFLPFAARHGLQDSYQPPACSRRPTALTGSTQRGARGASGSTKAQWSWVRSCLRPLFARTMEPLALMLSADPLPQSFHRARTGADGFTGFRINPLSCTSPLGHPRLLCCPGSW